MSLAAVPAYFLARRVAREGLALLAALLAVAIPSLAYTGTVMTENVFYPLFLARSRSCSSLVLERPSRASSRAPPRPSRGCLLDPRAGGRARSRGAPRAAAARRLRAPRRSARRCRGSAGSTGSWRGSLLAALVVLLVAGARRRTCSARTRRCGDREYDVAEALRYVWWHLAELSLYVLVIPLAATIVLVGRARSLDARLQAFLAATVALTACLVPVVATFASEFSRSDRGAEPVLRRTSSLHRARRLGGVAARRDRASSPRPPPSCRRLLVVAIPFDRFLTTSAITDTLMLLPLWSLQDRIGEDWVTSAAAVLAVGLAAAFLLVPRRYAVALPLVVLGLWILAIRPIWWGTHGFERFSRGALFQGIRTADRDWVDTALPDGATRRASSGRAAPTGSRSTRTSSSTAVSGPSTTSPTRRPGGLAGDARPDRPATPVGSRFPTASPVRDEYLLADSSFEPDGERARAGQGVGRHALAREHAARLGGAHRRSVSQRHVVGPEGHVRAAPVRSRAAVGLALERPEPVPRAADGSSPGRTAASSGVCASSPEGRAVLSVPVTPVPGTSDCRVVYTVTPDRRAGGGHRRREPGSARARRPLQPLRLQARAVRIAFDVSPLSPSAARDRELHPGLARRARRGRGRRARGRRLRADEHPRARSGSARRSRASTSRYALAAAVLACAAHCVERVGPTRPQSGSSARFDALHFSDWMFPPQRSRSARDDDPRPRPASPSGVDDRAHALDARPQVPKRGGDLRRRLRQLRVHRPRRDGDARRRRRADPRRASRAEGRLHGRTGQLPISARRTSSPSRRSSLGRTSRCSSRRTASSAASSSSRSSAPRAGASSRSSTARGSRRLGLRLRRGARAPLPRRGRRRVPVAVRGVRDPGHRGDGVRRPGRRVRRTSRSTRRAATAALRADPDDPAAFAAAIERALGGARAARRGRARAREGLLVARGR